MYSTTQAPLPTFYVDRHTKSGSHCTAQGMGMGDIKEKK